ncbi:MAG: single-stranded DNA-binding protein [Lentisphaerae bacterium]|nr:single-stranded DNA-binding protein [Lentisphaerota bacterium]
MAALNKVILLGHLTRDPELRRTPQGTSVCVLGLAVNRRLTTASGESREETCFVDIDVWGRQAESCAQYLRKGSAALVDGSLRLDQWDDRETGKRRSRLKVMADRVQFIGPPAASDGGVPSAATAPRPAVRPARPQAADRDEPPAADPGADTMPAFEPLDGADTPDTIPF